MWARSDRRERHVTLVEKLVEQLAEIYVEGAHMRMVRMGKLEALRNAQNIGIEIERKVR